MERCRIEKEDKVKRSSVELILGLFLVVGGALFLLQNLNVIPVSNLFWGFAFLFAGLVFLYVYLVDRKHWWALIPGFTLLGIGATVALAELAPAAGEVGGGALTLGGIALGFWVIYLTDIDRWWAIIPGGVILTLAIATLTDVFGAGFDGGSIFFLGMGVTFLLLWVLPTRGRSMSWALIPAVVLLAMGLLLSAAAASLINYLVPVLFIVIGAFFLLRTFATRTRPQP
jgi:hypothetical protein